VSHDITTPAYRTRLGNLAAKSVLILLADSSNPEGYGWPSIAHIVKYVEINKRTVLRVIACFQKIGLLTKVDRGASKNAGFQLSVEKLGTDLSAEYARAFAAAQQKPIPAQYRKSVAETSAPSVAETSRSVAETSAPSVAETSRTSVAETQPGVAETRTSVAETLPPNPHKGVTVSEPSMNRSAPAAPGVGRRRSHFINAVRDYWETKNKGVPMPWGEPEEKALTRFFDDNSQIDLATWVRFLRARGESDVNHGERPSRWLRQMTSYNGGPIDRFGKPKGAFDDGKGEHNLRILRECLEDISAGVDEFGDISRRANGQGNAFGLRETISARKRE
jgi:hypothetical protein